MSPRMSHRFRPGRSGTAESSSRLWLHKCSGQVSLQSIQSRPPLWVERASMISLCCYKWSNRNTNKHRLPACVRAAISCFYHVWPTSLCRRYFLSLSPHLRRSKQRREWPEAPTWDDGKVASPGSSATPAVRTVNTVMGFPPKPITCVYALSFVGAVCWYKPGLATTRRVWLQSHGAGVT